MRRRLFFVMAVLVLAGCGTRTPPSVRIDPALAILIPGDSLFLAGLKADALRTTPLYKKLGPDALSGIANGLNPGDVWEVLLASNGSQTAVLARGKFSSTGLEPEISRPGATRTPYKGYTLIGIDDTALVFLNPSTALAGRPAAVRAVLDQRGNSSGPPPQLAGEVASIPPDNQIWAAGSGGPGQLERIAPHTGNLGNLATALHLIERFRAFADLRNGARIGAVALCRSERDAESLGGAFQAMLALARLNDPRMQNLAASVRVEVSARTVNVNGTIPEDVLESLLAR